MKSLGKNWIRIVYYFCRLYVIFASVAVFLYLSFVWVLYMEEDNHPKFCIVSSETNFDFMMDDNVFCQIDWAYFLNEPITFTFLIYAVFVGPVAMIGYFVQCRMRKKILHHLQ